VLLGLRNLLAKVDQSLAQRGIGRSGLVSSLCGTWSDLAAVWSARQVLRTPNGSVAARFKKVHCERATRVSEFTPGG
jgi:hypothetical protein